MQTQTAKSAKQFKYNETAVCRTCLKIVHGASYYIHDKCDLLDDDGTKIYHILKFLVPELYLGVSVNPKICFGCKESIRTAYTFRKRCLKTENIIGTFLKNTRCTAQAIDLCSVLEHSSPEIVPHRALNIISDWDDDTNNDGHSPESTDQPSSDAGNRTSNLPNSKLPDNIEKQSTCHEKKNLKNNEGICGSKEKEINESDKKKVSHNHENDNKNIGTKKKLIICEETGLFRSEDGEYFNAALKSMDESEVAAEKLKAKIRGENLFKISKVFSLPYIPDIIPPSTRSSKNKKEQVEPPTKQGDVQEKANTRSENVFKISDVHTVQDHAHPQVIKIPTFPELRSISPISLERIEFWSSKESSESSGNKKMSIFKAYHQPTTSTTSSERNKPHSSKEPYYGNKKTSKINASQRPTASPISSERIKPCSSSESSECSENIRRKSVLAVRQPNASISSERIKPCSSKESFVCSENNEKNSKIDTFQQRTISPERKKFCGSKESPECSENNKNNSEINASGQVNIQEEKSGNNELEEDPIYIKDEPLDTGDVPKETTSQSASYDSHIQGLLNSLDDYQYVDVPEFIHINNVTLQDLEQIKQNPNVLMSDSSNFLNSTFVPAEVVPTNEINTMPTSHSDTTPLTVPKQNLSAKSVVDTEASNQFEQIPYHFLALPSAIEEEKNKMNSPETPILKSRPIPRTRKGPARRPKSRKLKIIAVNENNNNKRKGRPRASHPDREICVLFTSYSYDGSYINDHDYLITPYKRNKILMEENGQSLCMCFICGDKHNIEEHSKHMNLHGAKCDICNIHLGTGYMLNLHVKSHTKSCKYCYENVPYYHFKSHKKSHEEEELQVERESEKESKENDNEDELTYSDVPIAGDGTLKSTRLRRRTLNEPIKGTEIIRVNTDDVEVEKTESHNSETSTNIKVGKNEFETNDIEIIDKKEASEEKISRNTRSRKRKPVTPSKDKCNLEGKKSMKKDREKTAEKSDKSEKSTNAFSRY